MDKGQIVSFLCENVRQISEAAPDILIDGETPILGEKGILTSLQLVELMLALEDFCEENGQNFDWASDATFSTRNSAYASINSLADALAGKFGI